MNTDSEQNFAFPRIDTHNEILVWAENRFRNSFPVVQDNEICKIDISPETSAIVMKVQDKAGHMTEKLYARNDNFSQEISVSGMQALLSERLKGH